MESKIKPSVKVFTVISLVCFIFRIVLDIVTDNFYLFSLLQLLIDLIPCLLLAFCVFTSGNAEKINSYISTVFMLFAVSALLPITNSVISYFRYSQFVDLEIIILDIIINLPELIQFIIFIIAEAGFAKDSLKIKKCLTAFYIGIIVAPFKVLFPILLGGSRIISTILRIVIMTGFMAVSAAFITNVKGTKTIQEQLQSLKSQYGQGKITAEEYEKARASILKNL